MLTTRKSNPNKPVRILVYGEEGVGKSTLGAKADNPVFITPEGGADQLTDMSENPCEEMPDVNSWDRLRGALRDLLTQEHHFKTVVLDSADWIEGLAHKKIIGTSGKSITTVNGGYGTGYRMSQNMHQELISDLEELRNKKGMNVVITAHAHVKQRKDPSVLEDYDQFEIKCHEFVSSLWREWVDGLFFVKFRTFIKTSDDTQKARALSDGTRAVYTVKQPAFQAKNRFGMPPEMDFTMSFWVDFMKYARKGIKPISIDEIMGDIDELKAKVDANILPQVEESLIKATGNIKQLVAIRERLKQIIGKAS